MANRGFGQLAREARERKSWTQADLADRLQTSTTTISNIEREETTPSIDQVNQLCVALNLSPEAFLQAMGAQLTPPAAAKLPRDLVQELLSRTPEELDALALLLSRTPVPERRQLRRAQ